MLTSLDKNTYHSRSGCVGDVFPSRTVSPCVHLGLLLLWKPERGRHWLRSRATDKRLSLAGIATRHRHTPKASEGTPDNDVPAGTSSPYQYNHHNCHRDDSKYSNDVVTVLHWRWMRGSIGRRKPFGSKTRNSVLCNGLMSWAYGSEEIDVDVGEGEEEGGGGGGGGDMTTRWTSIYETAIIFSPKSFCPRTAVIDM